MPELYRCLRVCLLVVASALALAPIRSFAQEPTTAAVPAAPVSDETVLDVRVAGNETIDLQKITPHIQTRAGRPFNLDTVAEDVRRLTKTRLFVDVDTTYQRSSDGGLIVIFRVAERPTLRYVKYLGSTVRESTLTKQANLKKGDSQDPFMVVEARRKLEEWYQSKGYGAARVEIVEGDRSGDKGAIFVINEGKKQRIEKIEFIGNLIASDARLKTQVESKTPWFYILKGEVSRQKIDQDVEKLTAYYRSLGYFRARIGRELEFNEEQNWLTLRFVIDEGPRYTVRNVSVIGNKKLPSTDLLTDIELHDGQFFDQGLMDRDVLNIQDRYGSDGFIFAAVDAEPRFLEEPGQLDLVYHIDEGDRYHIGRIFVNILGDTPRTRRHTVMNYVSVKPGDIADTRKLRDSETRLQRSQLFTNNPSQGVAPRIFFKQPGLTELDDMAKAAKPGSVRGQSPDPQVADQPAVRFQSPYPSSYAPGSTTGAYGTSAGQVPLGRTSPDMSAGYASPTMQRDPRTGQFVQTQYTPPPPAAYPATATPYPAAPAPQYAQAPAYTQPPAYTPAPVYAPAPTSPLTAPAGGPPSYLAQPGTTAGPGSTFPAPPLPGAPGDGVAGGYTTPGELFPPQGYPFLDPSGNPTRPVDVGIDVTEAQTGRLMFGVGVNSNAGLVGSLILDEQNFDWRRLPTSFDDVLNGRAWRGGGQQLRIEAVPGNQVSRYSFTFRQPYLFDGPVSFNFSGYYFQRFYQAWSEQRLGGRGGLGYQFPTMPNLSIGASLRMEQVTIYNPRIPTPQTVTDVLGDSSLYTFRGSLAHDTRDSTFLATQGHLIDLGFEQAFGDFDYSRGTVDASQHFLLKERADRSGRHTLTLGTQLGFSGSSTPVYENFFAGGYASLRGFQFRGASPTQFGSQVGGRFQWLNTVEYMFPITADDALRGVAFCDFGTVEQNISMHASNYRVAPGLGLRVTIPMMGPAPIALDFAVPVAHAPGDQISNFQFFISGAR